MKVKEIDAWVMERFGKDHTWTLLWGGLTPDEEDKVYYRLPDFHVLYEDGTSSTKGIAILWEEKEDACKSCGEELNEDEQFKDAGDLLCEDCYDACKETWKEQCACCSALLGDKVFTNKNEFDEHPDREVGYTNRETKNEWLCPNCRDDEGSFCDQCDNKFPEGDMIIVNGWDWCPSCVASGGKC